MAEIILNGLTGDQLFEGIRLLLTQNNQDVLERIKAIEDDKLLTVDATRKLFHPSVTRQTISNWCKQGLLKPHRLGRSVFFRKSEVFGATKTMKGYTSVQACSDDYTCIQK